MTEEFGLSERELDILELLVGGAGNKEIASRLVISTNTVKVHLRNIYAKLGVSSRTEAAMIALRHNLVSVEGMGMNGELDHHPDHRQISIPFLGKVRFRGDSLGWYLTLGIIVVLLIAIVGMLIIVREGENGLGLGTTSEFDLETQRWQLLADLPTARTGLAVTAYENQIYVIGGETKREISGFVERFDALTNTWEHLADKPVPVKDIGAVVIGGMIYVPGGQLESGEITNVLEAFNPVTEEWRGLEPLPIPISAYALVSFEGKLYLFGGWDGEVYLNMVLSYDPQTNLWIEKTPMQEARAYAGAGVSGGVIYVMGGTNGSVALDLNEAYFPQRENTGESPWHVKSPMPEGRYAFGVTSVADILHILGGIGETESLEPLKYFPQGDTWQAFLPPKTQHWSHMGVTAIESLLYAMGGQRGDRISGENLSYKAIYTITLPLVE